MSSWSSYPSIFGPGHRAIRDLFLHEVNVEEKVDGSQFSFGLVPTNLDDNGKPVDQVHSWIQNIPYTLKIRSKGCVMIIDAPEKMFTLGANTVKKLYNEGNLNPGWTYRGEFLAKPKHNSLAYDRAPIGNVILFDINTGDQEYLSYADKKVEAERLGLECVPLLFTGRIGDASEVRRFLDTTSILGGQRIEGVVIKPVHYDLYGLDKKVLMGKFVSEAFKEVHRKAWGESNPTSKDIIAALVDELKQPTRWNKAIAHLKEAGQLTGTVQDIGPLIREIPQDILKEEEDYIKGKLFGWAWSHIRRGVTVGFPEFYKDLLLKQSFEHDDDTVTPQEPVGDGSVNGGVTSSIGSSIDLPSNLSMEEQVD